MCAGAITRKIGRPIRKTGWSVEGVVLLVPNRLEHFYLFKVLTYPGLILNIFNLTSRFLVSYLQEKKSYLNHILNTTLQPEQQMPESRKSREINRNK